MDRFLSAVFSLALKIAALVGMIFGVVLAMYAGSRQGLVVGVVVFGAAVGVCSLIWATADLPRDWIDEAERRQAKREFEEMCRDVRRQRK